MKKLNLYVRFSFILLLFLVQRGIAQITVTPGATAAALAAKLTGPGILVLNPVLTCPSNAEGIFAGTSTLSFDSGIVLTSGDAISVANPASFSASTANGTPGDAQLTALSGHTTYDACVLEFDFRPTGDTVKFNYVFGSEEYTEFTCDEFNDVFAFYISGPGIGTPTNIALVPGTSIPVCINSINCGPTGFGGLLSNCTALGAGSPFCAYYVNNLSGTTIAYDGLTTTLTAIAQVTPCDTYHLKLGVADAVDDILDSGVFIEAGSLTSNSFSISSVGINPSDTGYGSQYAVRGCIPGMFVFHNTGSLADTLTIHYVIGGTAVNGYDYTTIADSSVIPAHDSVDTIFIHGLVVPPGGPKTVTLYILSLHSCGTTPTIIDSVQLTIYDSFYVHVNTSDTAICYGQSVHINASGAAALTYSWSPATGLNTTTGLTPMATPSVTTTYVVTATYPSSGCPPSSDQVKITVYQYPVPDAGADTQRTCMGVPLQLNVTVAPSGVPYLYSWTPATYLNNATIPNPVVAPGVVGNAVYHVLVTTPVAGCSAADSFVLHVLPNDFTLVNADTGICFPPAAYQIFATGSSEFSYSWSPTGGVSNPAIINPIIAPAASTTYTVTASYPGCPDMHHTILYSIENPRVNIITSDTTVCILSPVNIPISVTPADSPYTFTWSSPSGDLSGLVNPSVLNTQFFWPIPGNYTYYLTVTSGLGCTFTDSVTYHPAPPVQVTVTPAVSSILLGESVQLNTSTDSPNPLIYTWLPNNGTLDNPNINNPVATPTDSANLYTLYAMNEWGCGDTVTALIYVDASMEECIPTAFTPNKDGRNDLFRLCDMHYRKLVDFKVYNRWGQTIYSNTSGDVKAGWDGTFNGKDQDMGVYTYMITIAKPDGTTKVYKGEVTLIR